MLSDEVIDKVIERLVNRIENVNLYTLKQIAKTIKKMRTLNPSDTKKIIEILNYGGDYKKIIRELAKVTSINEKEIYEIFDEVAKTDYQFAKEFYKYRNKEYIPYKLNKTLQDQVDAIAKVTADTYKNISKTLAFSRNVKGKQVYSSIGETYQDIIDEGIIAISQGKDTLNQQMNKIIKELSKSGIKSVDWESGTSRSLEYAVRMNIQDGLRELHNELQKTIGEEIGADGIEISVHSNPAPDHQYAQGRQFSKEEYEKLQSSGSGVDNTGRTINLHRHLKRRDEDSESFRPISKMNCYHYEFSIILGVNRPQYTDEQLQEIIDKNDKGFEYQGKHYSMYEGTQLQRKIENAIRKEKNTQIMARESGEEGEELAQESQKKINQLVNEYYKVSQTSGLSTKLERIQVNGYKEIKITDNPTTEPKVKSSQLTLATLKQEENKLNPILDNKFYNSSKIFNYSKQYLDLTNNENINIYNATNQLKIDIYERKNLKKANYNRVEKKISATGVQENSIIPTADLWHELGHALDNNDFKSYLSNSDEINNAMSEYRKKNPKAPDTLKEHLNSFKNKANEEFEKNNNYDDFYNNYIEIKRSEGAKQYSLDVYKDRWDNDREDYKLFVDNDWRYRKELYYYNKKRTDIDYAQIGNLSDIFSAISRGSYNNDVCGKYGYHTRKYYTAWGPAKATTEMFANFVSLKMTGSKIHLEFLKKEAPDIYNELEKLYKQIGDDLSVK
jgi:hypothetical protein